MAKRDDTAPPEAVAGTGLVRGLLNVQREELYNTMSILYMAVELTKARTETSDDCCFGALWRALDVCHTRLDEIINEIDCIAEHPSLGVGHG